jgi:diacylglycerol kinase family enzyme
MRSERLPLMARSSGSRPRSRGRSILEVTAAPPVIVAIRCEPPLPVQVDGELLGELDLIELGVVPDAARLLV